MQELTFDEIDAVSGGCDRGPVTPLPSPYPDLPGFPGRPYPPPFFKPGLPRRPPFFPPGHGIPGMPPRFILEPIRLL